EMAQLALQAGFPGEAQKVLEEGYARAGLGQPPQAARANPLREQVRKAVATDTQALSQASAATAKNADVLMNMGYALATTGQPDKGLSLMEQALARGGLKKPDEARLHLGVAQFNAGRRDAAVQTLQGVKGKDGSGDLAHLWVLLAQSQANAAAAAAAPAPAASGTAR
ncbi:MAG TPA: hypothetical protein VFM52_10145, partial [Rhodanobacter sp.]|nr:hypothetical protein [Rhodanobacter sp.]